MRNLEDSDPVPFVLAHLKASTKVTGMLAAAGTGGHITGIREAPWPALVVSPGADDLGDGLSVIAATVTLELYDTYDEAVGPYQSRRILLAAVQSLTTMPDHYPHTMPDGYPGTGPIITNVEPTGTVYSLPTTAGQRRLSIDVLVHLQAGIPSPFDP